MSQNNQAQPAEVILMKDFRERKQLVDASVARDIVQRATLQVLSGKCDPDVARFYANATDQIGRIQALSWLMTESEMDALSDFLEGLTPHPSGEPNIIL
ncbi:MULTISPECIES: hypothetical protein [unclassified Yoonia]|uniref:hypothetical protein n=1 Tax=unclassified Yoonia TaxID=2629118 RepID=UPI002AFDE3B4|nr:MULTISPECIES: hypothetical protein [unclassified Yoonia]